MSESIVLYEIPAVLADESAVCGAVHPEAARFSVAGVALLLCAEAGPHAYHVWLAAATPLPAVEP